tara:strand:+ start:2139 stop:2438 length:300 start_codon:yes stop_codon:yes gene_type:complete
LTPSSSIRIDVWLWHARFFKSRSLSNKICASGKIRVNGLLIKKTHLRVRPGDILTFPISREVIVLRIEKISDRRGPASEAQTLYTIIKENSVFNRVCKK